MLDRLYREPGCGCKARQHHEKPQATHCFSIYIPGSLAFRQGECGAKAGLIPQQGSVRCSGRTWRGQPGPLVRWEASSSGQARYEE